MLKRTLIDLVQSALLRIVGQLEGEGPPLNGDLNGDLDESDFLAIFPLADKGRDVRTRDIALRPSADPGPGLAYWPPGTAAILCTRSPPSVKLTPIDVTPDGRRPRRLCHVRNHP
jgi:hypothetical protein